jgi:hypothetical protein
METKEPIEEVLKHLQQHIFKGIYRGQDCYIKLSINKQIKANKLQQTFFKLTRFPSFAPTTVGVQGEKGTNYEAEKLRRLARLGLNVPEVYSYSDTYGQWADSPKNSHNPAYNASGVSLTITKLFYRYGHDFRVPSLIY